jgi:exopolysaccharide biosynthesis predicted pyruvyltransferase EpsI
MQLLEENVDSEQDPYLAFLRDRADRVFYRSPYPGNAGDSLIQFATPHVLDGLRVRLTVDPRDADVILIPGGNPTMWRSIGPERWRTLSTRYPRAELVIGPAGFRNGYSDWVRSVVDARSTISALFARDPESFDVLRAAPFRPGLTCGLSHDPVLYLRNSAWIAAHRRAAAEEYDLCAFRNDHETNLAFPTEWHTLRRLIPSQRLLKVIIRNRAAAMRSRKIRLAVRDSKREAAVAVVVDDVSGQRFEIFVETVRAARVVHTDRLHVMLLAALLGKRVFAYPTSHAKLEGVYRHSLAAWADVTFVAM